MKKAILAILMMAGIVPMAKAQDELPKIQVDCETVKLRIDTNNNRLNVYAYWKNKAVFPNPPTTGFTRQNEKFSIECPNLSIKDDGNMVELKAKSYENIVKSFPEYERKLELYSISGYRYPNIKEGFYHSGYSINLSDFTLSAAGRKIGENSNLLKQMLSLSDIPSETVLAYKVKNGQLKPIIYDQYVYTYLGDLKKATSFDIYQKLKGGVAIARIFVDKENGVLRIYRESEFPES